MTIFERQLRVWGEIGQRRIEDCTLILSTSRPSSLLQEILISLSLAGLRKIYAVPDSRLEWEPSPNCPAIMAYKSGQGYADVIYLTQDRDELKVPADLRARIGALVIVLEQMPIVVLSIVNLRDRLFLAHHLSNIPPFSLLEIQKELEPLCSRWLSPPLRTSKVPWLLLLAHCAYMLRAEDRTITHQSLKQSLEGLDGVDPGCLKQARLHMYWILNAPRFVAAVDASLSSEDQLIAAELLALGRLPVFGGSLPDDLSGDDGALREMHAVFNGLRREDELRCPHLTPFLRKKGLGTLRVVRAQSSTDRLPALSDLPGRSRNKDTLIECVQLPPTHVIAPLLSTQAAIPADSIIQAGLQLLQAGSSSKPLEPSSPVMTAFETVVGGCVANEVLKLVTQQLHCSRGIVVFE